MNFMPLFTVGHSTHEMEELVRLLLSHGVTAVGDVRSHPFSRRSPQFNRENLVPALKDKGIDYVFLGQELGGRSEDPQHYVDGKVYYRLVADSDRFREGVERVVKGIKRYSIALLCAEKDPLFCHRMILVCRYLRKLGPQIGHIHGDGSLETQQAAEERLLSMLNLNQPSMFSSTDDLIEQAYDLQGERISYVKASVGQAVE